MAFIDNYALATDVTFRSKLRIAICAVANTVAIEAPTSKNVLDEKRSTLATKVLHDGGSEMLDAFSFAASSLGTISSGSSDSEIVTAVTSVWNGVAGVLGKEL